MTEPSTNRALGNLAMLFDIIPTLYRPKLRAVEAGTAEFDYMLATIVFDLVKKNAMIHKVLREYTLHADPDVTRKILHDIRSMESLEQDYEALAHATEEMMLEAVEEVADDHIALGELVARWDEGGATSA